MLHSNTEVGNTLGGGKFLQHVSYFTILQFYLTFQIFSLYVIYSSLNTDYGMLSCAWSHPAEKKITTRRKINAHVHAPNTSWLNILEMLQKEDTELTYDKLCYLQLSLNVWLLEISSVLRMYVCVFVICFPSGPEMSIMPNVRRRKVVMRNGPPPNKHFVLS